MKYLINVNLLYFFSLWNSDEYNHQSEIDPFASDKSIWELAKLKDLTIITMDSDFFERISQLNVP
jgi:predicted nuclease of predicted toxin-antitoxin system